MLKILNILGIPTNSQAMEDVGREEDLPRPLFERCEVSLDDAEAAVSGRPGQRAAPAEEAADCAHAPPPPTARNS